MTVAGDFSITYHKHFKVLKNLRVTPAKTYVLRMCGSDVPTKYPNGTAIESDAKHFSVPVKGVGVGGSIPMAFLEQLDLLDKIKVADPQYVHSPCIRNAEKAGTILGQGSGSSHAAGWADKTKSNDAVDLVVTDAWSTGACSCDKDVVFDPSSDDTPLGRAEWIKYISTFFNEENRANVAFAREKAAYDATKRIAKDAADVHASLQKPKKKCAWVNEYYDSNWNSFWKLDIAPYKLAYCADAGMEAVTDKDSNGVAKNYVKSGNDLKNALADVDVVIDETYDSDPATNLDTQEKVLKNLGITLKQGAVLLRLDRELSDNSATSTKFYENNAGDSGINWAWTESGVLRPAHVLQGLVHAVWPDSVKEIPAACVDYFRDVTAGEKSVVKDHTHCDKWDKANADAQCVTNIISDDEMALIRDSPAAKPSFIVAILVALVVALIGA